jgi:hypothetical protein
MAKSSVDRYDVKARLGEGRGSKRRLLGRFAYLLGVVSLLGYLIVLPPWVGNSYMPAYDNPDTYQWHGTFGLRDSELNSPIWNPPRAHSAEINPIVRWPWQAATARAHVELSTFNLAWRIAVGMVLLGLVLRVWNGITARNRRDRFVDMAWSVSLGTAISILGLMVYGAFTAGYGLTDAVVVGGLSAGALFGLFYGAVTFRPHRVHRSLFSVTELAWFALGLAGSLVIMMVAGNVAHEFRGDPIGVTSAYAGDQTLINMVTGVVIGLSGLAVSWVFAWFRMPRGLVIGMFVGALLLGAMLAFSF